MIDSPASIHPQLNAECDPRLDYAAARYMLDSAHNRRRFMRSGVSIASGGREFFALPLESRSPIYARPAFHPEEPDANDIARAQIRDAIFAVIDAAERLWAHRKRLLLRVHRMFWRRDTRARLGKQRAIIGGAIAVIIFALLHHGY